MMARLMEQKQDFSRYNKGLEKPLTEYNILAYLEVSLFVHSIEF